MKLKNNKRICVKVRYKLQKYIIKLEQRKIANTYNMNYESSRFVSLHISWLLHKLRWRKKSALKFQSNDHRVQKVNRENIQNHIFCDIGDFHRKWDNNMKLSLFYVWIGTKMPLFILTCSIMCIIYVVVCNYNSLLQVIFVFFFLKDNYISLKFLLWLDSKLLRYLGYFYDYCLHKNCM